MVIPAPLQPTPPRPLALGSIILNQPTAQPHPYLALAIVVAMYHGTCPCIITSPDWIYETDARRLHLPLSGASKPLPNSKTSPPARHPPTNPLLAPRRREAPRSTVLIVPASPQAVDPPAPPPRIPAAARVSTPRLLHRWSTIQRLCIAVDTSNPTTPPYHPTTLHR